MRTLYSFRKDSPTDGDTPILCLYEITIYKCYGDEIIGSLEQNNDGENVPFFFSIRNQIITATQKLKFNFVKEIQNN